MHISTPRLVSCGSQYASHICSGLENKFWADFKYIVENSPAIESVPNVPIFDNKNIMIGGKHIIKKHGLIKRSA